MNEHGFKSPAHKRKYPKDTIRTGSAVSTGYGYGIVVDRNGTDLTVLVSERPNSLTQGVLYGVTADSAIVVVDGFSEKLHAEADAFILGTALQDNIHYEWARNTYLVSEYHNYKSLGKPTFEELPTEWGTAVYARYTTDTFCFSVSTKKPCLPSGDIMAHVLGHGNGYLTVFKPNKVVSNRKIVESDYKRVTRNRCLSN